jgi:hypothetical protein
VLRFAVGLLLVVVFLALTTWLGSVQGWWSLPLFWKEIILFMFLITLIIGYKLVQMRRRQAETFVQFYLLSITVKMVAGLTFVFFIVWKNPESARGSAALFILSYLLFTLAEVGFLMRKDPA